MQVKSSQVKSSQVKSSSIISSLIFAILFFTFFSCADITKIQSGLSLNVAEFSPSDSSEWKYYFLLVDKSFTFEDVAYESIYGNSQINNNLKDWPVLISSSNYEEELARQVGVIEVVTARAGTAMVYFSKVPKGTEFLVIMFLTKKDTLNGGESIVFFDGFDKLMNPSFNSFVRADGNLTAVSCKLKKEHTSGIAFIGNSGIDYEYGNDTSAPFAPLKYSAQVSSGTFYLMEDIVYDDSVVIHPFSTIFLCYGSSKRTLKVKDISFNTYNNATLTLDNIVLESENKFKIAALGTLKLLGNASVKNGIVLEKGGTIEIVSPLTSASKMQVNIDAAGSGEVVIKNGAASISHFEFTKDVEIVGSDIRKK